MGVGAGLLPFPGGVGLQCGGPVRKRHLQLPVVQRPHPVRLLVAAAAGSQHALLPIPALEAVPVMSTNKKLFQFRHTPVQGVHASYLQVPGSCQSKQSEGCAPESVPELAAVRDVQAAGGECALGQHPQLGMACL